MTFLIVGLGLIGGSLAKAISGRTDHLVVGLDTNAAVVAQAVDEGAIARRATERDLQTADVVIVALHPQATIDYLKDNWRKFSPETMIFDTCGVKGAIYEALAVELAGEGPIFIGGHPMAGRERYGYDHALVDLFDGASLILTPGPYKGQPVLADIDRFAKAIGFAQTVITTPETHDRIIAYTSQLAHVVSSAYMMSPTADLQAGFSAGSFRDLTRVARLDANLWRDLFLFNAPDLVHEIDELIAHLLDLRRAIAAGDGVLLKSLLAEGSRRKERNDAGMAAWREEDE